MKFLLALFLISTAHAEKADTLTLVVEGKESVFTLAALKKQLKIVTVTIEDPVYHSAKTFDGFPLNEVLELAGLQANTHGDEIVFTAKDGYAPNTSFAALAAHKAVLAFQEHGTKGQFGKVAQGKVMVSPAPFYVVWSEGKALEDKVPWPYQLVRIEVVNFAKKFGKIFPLEMQASSPVMKGFHIFKNECIRCHSLNLQGGDLGPELNSPKNVTEYWNKGTLRQFIRDASSFRQKDKMPSFPQLTEQNLDEILEYLSYMKDRKI